MNELIFNNAVVPGSVNLLNQANAASFSEKNHNKADLKKVAEEFEAVFIAQLLKIMRETIQESGVEGGGFGKSVYTELFDQEVALSMARRGALGIGDIIYRSFTDDGDSTPVGEAPPKWNASQPAPEASNSLSQSDAVESEWEIPALLPPVHAQVSSTFGVDEIKQATSENPLFYV